LIDGKRHVTAAEIFSRLFDACFRFSDYFNIQSIKQRRKAKLPIIAKIHG